ncbi:tRNA pseudouridine(38-40) synthase TruA [Ohessyouella blattaphilus]|uniref:tRNA pseudouridine(38-40) synthase TruA n=1 Tax=Ohessyouella blattaphilus TaxID=2949333 RepID=UPI003EB74D48
MCLLRYGFFRRSKVRIKLTIAYDGTNYAGWQIQKNALTIEEVLNKALTKLTGEQVAVIGASRTDSGVHAAGQIAVFDTDSSIPAERFSYAINQKLPADIVVLHSEAVPDDWHPRYQDKILKTYRYRILNTKEKDPLRRLYTAHVSFPLAIDNMQEASSYLLGTHDFTGFSNIKSEVLSGVRTITALELEKVGEEIALTITGDGFLYNMVRMIAGVLIRVGRGFYGPEKVKEILENRERTKDRLTAPACGLTLLEIRYDEE